MNMRDRPDLVTSRIDVSIPDELERPRLNILDIDESNPMFTFQVHRIDHVDGKKKVFIEGLALTDKLITSDGEQHYVPAEFDLYNVRNDRHRVIAQRAVAATLFNYEPEQTMFVSLENEAADLAETYHIPWELARDLTDFANTLQ